MDRVPEAMEVTHINLNDNSIEGMRSKDLRIMCVQYHPEAWPDHQTLTIYLMIS